MEMDCNLKKLATFFKFFMCILEKLLKFMMVCYSLEKNLNIFFQVLKEQFHVTKQFFVKYLFTQF